MGVVFTLFFTGCFVGRKIPKRVDLDLDYVFFFSSSLLHPRSILFRLITLSRSRRISLMPFINQATASPARLKMYVAHWVTPLHGQQRNAITPFNPWLSTDYTAFADDPTSFVSHRSTTSCIQLRSNWDLCRHVLLSHFYFVPRIEEFIVCLRSSCIDKNWNQRWIFKNLITSWNQTIDVWR